MIRPDDIKVTHVGDAITVELRLTRIQYIDHAECESEIRSRLRHSICEYLYGTVVKEITRARFQSQSGEAISCMVTLTDLLDRLQRLYEDPI